MQARDVKNNTQARKIVEQRGLSHVKVGVFDIDGVLRGKYMSKEKFFSALDNGFGFCNVVLGWDVKDQLYDNVKYTGWHTGYPDATLKILPESCRELPLECAQKNNAENNPKNNMLFFLAEFSGDAQAICPRSVLRNVIKKAQEMGLEIFSGFEYEFFVFNESAQTIREKNYQNLQTLAPGEFGYSVIRNTVESDIYHEILQLSETMGFNIEGLHEETGPGVLEAAITYSDALSSADKASLFKTFSKIALQKKGKIATFMARWSEKYPGQSGHIHVSAKSTDGDFLFYDENDPNNMSELMKYFVAGQQKLMPELLAMIAPTINSYRRLIPGFWAPRVDNRTCAIRIIKGNENGA